MYHGFRVSGRQDGICPLRKDIQNVNRVALMQAPIRYTIFPKNPGAHLFEVTLTVDQPDPIGQVLSMAAWIPGSYMIRDYARHIVGIRAESDGVEVTLSKSDKSTWIADPCNGPLQITAEIYAHDQSVRGAHLDTTHAYFNGTCVFLKVHGKESLPCEVDIQAPPPPIGKDWRVATSMRNATGGVYSFGLYHADNYDELIDHPVEIGALKIGEFEAGGIPHAIAIRGECAVDMGRLCRDLGTLCSAHMLLVGKPKDLDRYLFLLSVVSDGYGGLEHCWSSSLVCSRKDLPRRGDESISEDYRKLLGLFSHEYFHLWNVKRMKPATFTPYDLRAESHTGLLWVFEGITSYYDDLVLARSGLINEGSYLELLGQTITRVLRGSGRFLQSVEESSFDAWTKFYKQEANASNAIVSYYTKGALIALALDLTLRERTDGRCTLNSVFRECWKRYGETGIGMPERGLEAIASELSGFELSDFFECYVRGTTDLPLENLLAYVGIKMNLRASQGSRDLGGKNKSSTGNVGAWLGASLVNRDGESVFGTIRAGGPAENAGVAAGDIAVAMDRLRLGSDNLQSRLTEQHAGDKVSITVFRGDELLRFPVLLAEPPKNICFLTLMEEDQHADARANWLTGQARN